MTFKISETLQHDINQFASLIAGKDKDYLKKYVSPLEMELLRDNIELEFADYFLFHNKITNYFPEFISTGRISKNGYYYYRTVNRNILSIFLPFRESNVAIYNQYYIEAIKNNRTILYKNLPLKCWISNRGSKIHSIIEKFNTLPNNDHLIKIYSKIELIHISETSIDNLFLKACDDSIKHVTALSKFNYNIVGEDHLLKINENSCEIIEIIKQITDTKKRLMDSYKNKELPTHMQRVLSKYSNEEWGDIIKNIEITSLHSKLSKTLGLEQPSEKVFTKI